MLIYGIAPPEAAEPLWLSPDPGPTAAFHPDNKELPAARTGSLLNEISYQSANSCELGLAGRSDYESPRAALNSYCLEGVGGGGGDARFPYPLCKFHPAELCCQGRATSYPTKG